MRPIFGFVLGILISELWQWGTWKAKHVEEGWFGYWKLGLPHLMTNALGDIGIAVCWQKEWLDELLALMPGTGDWANVGLPYTPQVGFLLGAAADLFSDQLAYLLTKVVGSRLPFLKKETEQAPPTEGGGQ